MIKTLRTKLLRFSIIFLAFLIACNPAASQAVPPTHEGDSLPATTSIPTATSIPTPSYSSLELSSASELPLPTYHEQCIETLHPTTEMFKKSLEDLGVDGVAVFSENINDRETIVFLNLRSSEKHTIPEDSSSTDWTDVPKVSPDGKWLFYLTGTENDSMGSSNFVLSNSEGIETNRLPVSIVEAYGFDFQFAHDWLNNSSLRLLSQKDYRDSDLVVLVLDPFTGEITQLRNHFDGMQSPLLKFDLNPNNSPNHQYLDWGIDPFYGIIIFLLNGTNVAYSPEKNLAFFPHENGYDVLYDLISEKELVQLIIPNWGELPRWSKSGDNLSIIATPPNFSSNSTKKDFYLLSKDGKNLRRLTYLSEQFERISIKEYSWSPDGKKIAFWLNTDFPLSEDDNVVYELAIVDTTNGNVTNLCITNPSFTVKQLSENAGFLGEPVWSQDSDKLLVEVTSVEKSMPDFYTESILVIPSKLSALTIMKDAQLKGWMVDEP